jgi:tetratricopeptide (TPR) repeat protein
MADRLVVDLTDHDQVVVSAWPAGELALSPVGQSHPAQRPLDAEALEDLRWYLEDYLRLPYGVYEQRGPQVAARVRDWGQTLFAALFGTEPARLAYAALRPGADTELLIRSASPKWLDLPWEMAWDPGRPAPLAVELASVSRMLPAASLPAARAPSGSRLRVLMVIARPAGLEDVGYRMIARPLLERLESVRGEVDLQVLRPPTFEALQRAVQEAATTGQPYQLVHFDGHGVPAGRRTGGSLARLNRPVQFAAPHAEGLLFETKDGGEDRVAAAAFAMVVRDGQVPVVVLNACQSGAMGDQIEAAIATRLLQDGAASVVAMGYSVYVVAAAEFMAAFYEALFAGRSVGEAVTAGRQRLFHRTERPSPKGPMPLQDWMVPVHYAQRDIRFPDLRPAPTARPGRLSLDDALDQLRARRLHGWDTADPLEPVGRFIGRDDVIYQLELACRLQRLVVIHGPGGTGKTELAKAFGRWWQDTGGVDFPNGVIFHSFEPGVATFGLDGVVTTIGLQLFGPDFTLVAAGERRDVVAQTLRDHRLLLIWDNFETVASMPDPAQATPPLEEDERKHFCRLLAELGRPGGKSAVLITSRAEEAWLGDVRRIPLGGMRPGEAAEYADDLLAPFPTGRARRARRAFADLLDWLDGHPLALRIMLPQLEHTPPERLLAALKGQAELPPGFEPDRGRTASLGASMGYSLAHLDSRARRLLPAVALFEGVADADVLGILSGDEYAPTRFREINRDQWMAILDSAAGSGLLTKLGDGMYQVHPALPAYLTAAWRNENPGGYPGELAAAQRALIGAYAALGDWLDQQIRQGDASTALAIIGVQRRSLGAVLTAALDAQRYHEAQAIIQPLTKYWASRGLTQETLAWVDRCRVRLEAADGTPPPLDSPGGALWLFMVGHGASRQLLAGDLDAAQATYEAVRTRLEAQPESEERSQRLGATCHQLGMVAEERGELDRAEAWYRQALAIKEQLDDRPGMATTHHHLGRVAQERGELDRAEAWYRQALAIEEELGDRPGMATTYHQLGNVARGRGELDRAEAWYRQALAIKEQLDDRPGMATTYHQLGVVAQHQEEFDRAEAWYSQALAIKEQLGDRRHTAATYHQLGRVAQEREELDRAEAWYRQALAIEEELGDRPGMATTYHQLGIVAEEREELDRAEVWYRQALTIFEQLADRRQMANSYGQLGLLAEDRRQPAAALEFMVRCVTLFDQFPDPATGPGPRHLVRLTRQLGMGVLDNTWKKVTGASLPRMIRAYVEDALDNEQEA